MHNTKKSLNFAQNSIICAINHLLRQYYFMVSKTREKFIEVARQLFARKGVENTTMNDIASASSKGRRTIYTYFKSKREIFNAVIETETDKILKQLRLIITEPIKADVKLRKYVICRFDAMKEIVGRNGSLRAGFFRDVRKVDRAQRMISAKEIALLCEILEEGIESGIFKVSNVRQQAVIIIHAMQGLVVPYIRNSLVDEGVSQDQIKEMLADMILNGIECR